MEKPDLYITTPLYYVNSSPHIGHTFTTVVSDVVKRYYSLFGKKVYFLTGTDEHGEKIAVAAKNDGKDVVSFVNDNSEKFRTVWNTLGIEYDDFIRTSEDRHKKVVRYVLQKLHDSGDIYFSSYEGKYCLGCERFISDAELSDGLCPDHGSAPKVVKEENYFFKLGNYTKLLKEKIEQNPEIIRPEWYRREVLGYLKEDIDDLCISRPKERVSWGIELPFDNKFVTYVWFDALLNYISAINYPDSTNFDDYWKVSEHFIAKDILRTHTIYWGCMLLSLGLPLYKHLNVHGYWNMSGMKMSKTLGNVIEPGSFKKIYGTDSLRFFFLREMHWGEDSDFTIERFISRYNSDLANNYGNLLSRTMGMMEKYYKDQDFIDFSEFMNEPSKLKSGIEELVKSYKDDFKDYKFHRTLELMWKLFDDTNRYIADNKPWELFKQSDNRSLSIVMSNVLEVIRISTYMLMPVMPESCPSILSEILASGYNYSNFDEFTRWGSTPRFNTSYKKRKFFDKIELPE